MLILSFSLPLSGWRRLKLGGVGLELIGGGGWVLKSLFLSELYSGWVVAGSPSATNLARGNEALAGFRAARLIHKQLAFLAFPFPFSPTSLYCLHNPKSSSISLTFHLHQHQQPQSLRIYSRSIRSLPANNTHISQTSKPH